MTVLPFLFSFYAKKASHQFSLNTIPIVWADLELAKNHPEFFLPYNGYLPPLREYVTIKLNGDGKHDKQNLLMAQATVKKLLWAKDTLQGVHFEFGDKTNYGSFIKALDILRASGAKTYMPIENGLWFYILPPAPAIEAEEITPLYCGTYLKETKVKQYERVSLQSQTQKAWNNMWPVLLGYVTLLIASIRINLKR